MSLASRETNIIWLNWKEMFYEAEERQDENFFQLSAILAHRIESLCGTENLIEWKGEYLCEDRGFDPTVMFHVRNIGWDWSSMITDLQRLSSDFPKMIFQVTLTQGQCSGKVYLTKGHLTAVLFDPDTDELIQAF
jgi:hypothetical protein